MKAYVKNIISGVALGLALLPQPLPTWAGTRVVTEVTVQKDSAFGATASARYSGDNRQTIGCKTFNNPGNRRVVCAAADKNGNAFVCSTDDPNLVEVADAITDYSYVFFRAAKPSSPTTCTSIYISNSSVYLH